ncbi:6-bladed beta-propeller [Paraflavitalea soli]|nr:6-bladed beta-propeller [Paraflavitalea soli]
MIPLVKVSPNLRFLLMLFIFAATLSCNGIRDGYVAAGNPVIIQLDSGNSFISLADLADSLQIVKLDTSDNSPFSEPENQRVMYVEGKIIVFDVKYMSIKVFDGSGKYLNSIGKLGMGMGAFVRAEDIQYYPPHRSIVVLCNKPTKICEFALGGQLIKDTEINFFASSFVMPSANTRIFFVNQNKSEISKDKNIIITDSAYKVQARLFDLPENILSTIRFSGVLHLVNNEVYFAPAFSNIYYTIKGDTAQPVYQVDYGKKNIPPGIQEDTLLFNSAKYGFQYETFIKNDNYVGFNYLNKNVCMAFYNLQTGKTITGDIRLDSLNMLFSSYTYGFGDKKYATFLNGKKISAFVRRNADQIREKYPDIGRELSALKPDENPSLLIYALKQ